MNNKNSDSLTKHCCKKITQIPSTQPCRDIMSFEIMFTVNPIGSIKI